MASVMLEFRVALTVVLTVFFPVRLWIWAVSRTTFLLEERLGACLHPCIKTKSFSALLQVTNKKGRKKVIKKGAGKWL